MRLSLIQVGGFAARAAEPHGHPRAARSGADDKRTPLNLLRLTAHISFKRTRSAKYADLTLQPASPRRPCGRGAAPLNRFRAAPLFPHAGSYALPFPCTPLASSPLRFAFSCGVGWHSSSQKSTVAKSSLKTPIRPHPMHGQGRFLVHVFFCL